MPVSTSTEFTGIDCGRTGAVAKIIDGELFYYKIPESDEQLRLILIRVGHCVVEEMRPFKGSLRSAFGMGRQYQRVLTTLHSWRHEYQIVRAATWMKLTGSRKADFKTDSQWKRHLQGIAARQFPRADIPLYAADAVMIALYCRAFAEGAWQDVSAVKEEG